ncbi:MAG: radical SAM protein [Deltaproteobacteria bacterium]|nr:radical SAM protein [Deltaproteobacteria bacterium]
MKCTSCGAAPKRPDRPHVYLKQEPISCAGCGARVQARTVLKGGEVFRLQHCAACGTSEERVGGDASSYLADFMAQGRAEGSGARMLKTTTAACPTCLDLIDAKVLVRGGKVFFDKACPRCGPSVALVSEDADWYVGAYAYSRAGSQPLVQATSVIRGCPEDCGLCPDHEQHTCVPIVEITDHCNLACPICIADNAQGHHLPLERFRRIVDGLVASEGQLETLALSGGEPTSHPQLLELIDEATRPQIGRVVLLTNGIRLGQDRALAQKLKQKGAYVTLQLDGFTAQAHTRLRGRDLTAQKEAALAALEELQIPTQLLMTVARGVNEAELGKMVELLLSKEHILSLNVQPITFSGRGGGTFPADPMDRITVPGVLKAIEAQTGGKVALSDFSPLPCPSPHCVALTYLLKLQDGSFVPFSRFADLRKHGGLLRNSASLPALPEIEQALQDVIYDLFARQDEVPQGRGILGALRRAVDVMFPSQALAFREALRQGERQAKSIFVHHYMDAYDFDLERLRKCCNHYPLADGRLMPACGFNLFHRGAAKGPSTPRASFARVPGT